MGISLRVWFQTWFRAVVMLEGGDHVVAWGIDADEVARGRRYGCASAPLMKGIERRRGSMVVVMSV